MKKIIALTLLTLFVLTACVPPKDNTTPFEEMQTEIDESNPTQGYVFLIKSEATELLSLAPQGDTLREDAIRTRYADVAKQLGCTIKAERIQPATTLEYFRVQKASASKYADLLESDTKTIYNLYKGGYLAPLENFDSLDVSSEKWGYHGQKTAVTPDGTYSFRPLYWGISAPTVSNVLFCNSDLILAAEMALPHALAEQENWTWESFEQLCEAVTHEMNDEQSVYAFANPTVEYPSFIWAAIYSNGGRLLKTQDSGPYCALTEMDTIDALTWVRKLTHDRKFAYTLPINPEFTDLDVRAFADRRTVFLVADSDVGFSTDEFYPATVMEDDLRWISFPVGPKGNTKETAWLTERDLLCTMTNDAHEVAAAQILEAMFTPLDGESENDWKRYLENTYFFHNSDFVNYLDMISNARPDGTVRTYEINKALDESLAYVIAGDKSAMQAMEEIEDVVAGVAIG